MRLFPLLVLLSACSACFVPNPKPVAEQYNLMTLIETHCSDGNTKFGTGVMVSSTQLLTAGHVVQCELVPGVPIFTAPVSIEVYGTVAEHAAASIEVQLTGDDVARLKVADDSLARFYTPLRVGPPPKLGEKVCEASAWPRGVYRCGVAQEGPSGRIYFDFKVQHGNSGSAIFDDQGRLVGIVTNLIMCADGESCGGYGTSLTGYAWIVPE